MNPAAPRVFGLDIVRAAAISLVLTSHVLFLVQSPTWAIMSGYFGVELFFVLSGFLIGTILLRDFTASTTIQTLRTFWLRRWFRTLPNYALFLAINLALAASLGRIVPSDLWRYLFFLQSFEILSPRFFPESWSLAIEEWFYVVSPVGILLCSVGGKVSVRRAAVIFILLMLVGASLWRASYVVAHNPSWLRGARSMVILRLDACMYGVLGAYVKMYHPRLWHRSPSACLALGVAVLVIASALFSSLPLDSSFHARTTLFSLTSAGVLLLLPWFDAVRGRTGIVATAVTRLSLWSYSVYLVNFPIYVVATHFLGAKIRTSGLWGGGVATGMVGLSVLLAAFNYRFFEKPVMDLRERWRSPPRAVRPGEGG